MNPERVTSLSLLDRARHHDEPSWQQLVTLYGPLVEYWCRRGGARPEDAADLAQEVFLAASQGLERFARRGPGPTRGSGRGQEGWRREHGTRAPERLLKFRRLGRLFRRFIV